MCIVFCSHQTISKLLMIIALANEAVSDREPEGKTVLFIIQNTHTHKTVITTKQKPIACMQWILKTQNAHKMQVLFEFSLFLTHFGAYVLRGFYILLMC